MNINWKGGAGAVSDWMGTDYGMGALTGARQSRSLGNVGGFALRGSAKMGQHGLRSMDNFLWKTGARGFTQDLTNSIRNVGGVGVKNTLQGIGESFSRAGGFGNIAKGRIATTGALTLWSANETRKAVSRLGFGGGFHPISALGHAGLAAAPWAALRGISKYAGRI